MRKQTTYREIPGDRVLTFPATPGFRGWEAFFTPDSTAHPAKMNLRLLSWILETFTSPGDVVLDPMAGTGSTVILAALIGRHGIAVEYEPRFCDMILGNIELALRQRTLAPKGGMACIEGDARELSSLLGWSDAIVTSPPFGPSTRGGGIFREGYRAPGDEEVSDPGLPLRHGRPLSDDPKNIDNLEYGDVDAVITSPPYGNRLADDVVDDGDEARMSYRQAIDSIVTSPPYEQGLRHRGQDYEEVREKLLAQGYSEEYIRASWSQPHQCQRWAEEAYGEDSGNIGNLKGGFEDRALFEIIGNLQGKPFNSMLSCFQSWFTVNRLILHLKKNESEPNNNKETGIIDTEKKLEKEKQNRWLNIEELTRKGSENIIANITESIVKNLESELKQKDTISERHLALTVDNLKTQEPLGAVNVLTNGEEIILLQSTQSLEESLQKKEQSIGKNIQNGETNGYKQEERLWKGLILNVNYVEVKGSFTSTMLFQLSKAVKTIPAILLFYVIGVIGLQKMNCFTEDSQLIEKSLKSQDAEMLLRRLFPFPTTYLSEMLRVYRECHKVLKPDGKLIVVTKNFIRDKQVVRLDLDTIRLCEAAGFRLADRWYFRLPARSFWKILYRRKYPDVPEVEHEDILVFDRGVDIQRKNVNDRGT